MPHFRLVLILALVILAAGLTVWLATALSSAAADPGAWRWIVPLALIAALVLRLATRRR